LQVYTSASVSSLSRRAVESVGEAWAALDDPFACIAVVVPNAGLRDLLTTTVADHFGVSAMLQFMSPGAWLEAATTGVDGGVWRVERLVWVVLAELQSAQRSGTPWPVPATLATSRHVADLFDRYAVQRPSILTQWAAGLAGDGTEDQLGAVVPLPDGQRWQAALWQAIARRLGVRHPQLVADQLPQPGVFDDHDDAAPGLPARALFFGVHSLPSGLLAVVRAFAGRFGHQVDVMVHQPSAHAVRVLPHRLAGRLVARRDVAAASAVRHPLLRSWAVPALETVALLHDAAGVEQLPSPQRPSTLLGTLQQQLDDDVPAVHPSHPVPVDDTVQLHACHGATRQLEVLRDALGHLFVADPTLQPHQVLIVTPDLSRFAPLAASVFSRGALAVPVRVADAEGGPANELLDALARVVALAESRCTVRDVIEFCALPTVQRRVGLDADDLDRVQRWCEALGTKWGLDAAHRAEWMQQPFDDGTWQQLLDRVFAGAAYPTPQPRVVHRDIAPYDDVDAAALLTAGRLHRVLTAVRSLRNQQMADSSPAGWAGCLEAVLDSVCAAPPDAPWLRAEAGAAIGDLANGATVAGLPVVLTASDVRLVLARAAADRVGRVSARSGAVPVASMWSMRGREARVVCILGLDDAVTRRHADGDDVLALRPCVGERDARAELRAALLDTVHCATERLLITFDGHDLTTNRRLPFPVVVDELLDALQLAAGDAGRQMVRHHPRHAHHPSNLDAATPFSFDPAMLSAAQAVLAEHADRRPDCALPSPLTLFVPHVIDIGTLVQSCTRPSITLLRDRLDVSVPPELAASDDNMPLVAGPLQRSELGRHLVAARLGDRGDDSTPDESVSDVAAVWRHAHTLSGRLPPRQLALGVLDQVSAEVQAMLHEQPNVVDLLYQARAEPVEVAITTPQWVAEAGGPASVGLYDEIRGVSGEHLVHVDFVRPRPGHTLQLAFELAVLALAVRNAPRRGVYVTRAKSGNGPPSTLELHVVADQPHAAARHVLQVAFDLTLRALREPIPLFAATSWQIAHQGSLGNETDFELPRGDLADRHTAFLWGSFSAEEMLALPWRPDLDAGIPAVSLGGFARPSRAASYAHYLWGAVNDFVQVVAQ
jgi:exodeoxyribonuclease V gamma subunit